MTNNTGSIGKFRELTYVLNTRFMFPFTFPAIQ